MVDIFRGGYKVNHLIDQGNLSVFLEVRTAEADILLLIYFSLKDLWNAA